MANADVQQAVPVARDAQESNLVHRPICFLVVDNEPDIRSLISDVVLAMVPHATVLTAGSGAEALELLDDRFVDVVLADYRMPGMTGLELLTRVRARHPRAGRVIFTGYPDEWLAITSINEARIHAFLRKPLDSDELVATLLRVVHELRGRQWRDEALVRAVAVGRTRYGRLMLEPPGGAGTPPLQADPHGT